MEPSFKSYIFSRVITFLILVRPPGPEKIVEKDVDDEEIVEEDVDDVDDEEIIEKEDVHGGWRLN